MFEYKIGSIDMYKSWMENMKHKCVEKGFSEGEAIYIINKIRNTIRRRTKGWNAYNFWVEIDEKDTNSSGEEINLKSGKIVKFGFLLN